MKRTIQRILIILLIVGLPIGFYVLDCIYEIRSTVGEIDIHSGRLRSCDYIFNIKLKEQIWDTALTKALAPEDLKDIQPEWGLMNTMVTGKSGLHARRLYYYASDCIHTVQLMAGEFDLPARRQAALTMLRLMQADGNALAALDYAKRLSDIEGDAAGHDKTLHVEDLPSSRTVGLARTME